MRWQEWLAHQAAERDRRGLTRRLAPRSSQDRLVDLAGNDYLGLARHPAIVEAAVAAARTWGAGAGASRLVTGTLALHDELERELAGLVGAPAALVTSTGYHANLAVLSALADRDTVVVSDAHVHASLIDAIRMARAEVAVVPHQDVGAVEAALQAAVGRRALVVVESVYSVLGDAAQLADLADIAAAYDALLVVDEAHALGVAGGGGRGLVHQLGLGRRPHVVVTATLSKAFGAQGGAVLGIPAVVEQVVNRGRPFIYDTGLAPPAAGAALAAVRLVRAEPERPALVRRRIAELAGVLGVATPEGAVLSVPLPTPQAALAAQQSALEAGVRIGCFRPPSTPDGVSRLRVTASAGLTDAVWDDAVQIVGKVVAMATAGAGDGTS